MIRRQRELIYFLLKQNNPIIGEEIASEFGVSLRSVRSDVKKINQELVNFGIKVSSSKDSGYLLLVEDDKIIADKSLFVKIVSKYISLDIPETQQERVIYLLLKSCVGEFLDTFQMEEELCVSHTTIIKDIQILKKLIDQKFPMLKIGFLENNVIWMMGTEESRRDLLSGVLSQTKDDVLLAKYSNYIFDSEFMRLFNIVRVLLAKIMIFSEDKFTGDGLKSFAFDIVVSYYRNYDGHIYFPRKYGHITSELIENLKIELENTELVLSEEDFSYLDKRYHSKTFLSRSKGYRAKEQVIYDILDQYFKLLEDNYGLNIRKDTLVKDLIQILDSILIRKANGYYCNESFKHEFYIQNQLDSVLVYPLQDIVFYIFELKLDNNDMYLIASLLSNHIREYCNFMEVILVCDQDKGYCTNICRKIEQLSNNNIKVINIINSMGLFVNKSNYDESFQVVSCDNFHNIDENVFEVNNLPVTYEDVNRLENKYTGFIFDKLKIPVICISLSFSDLNLLNTIKMIEDYLHIENKRIENLLNNKMYIIIKDSMVIPMTDTENSKTEIYYFNSEIVTPKNNIRKIIVIRFGEINYKHMYVVLNKFRNL